MARIIKALGFMVIDESVECDGSWIIHSEKQELCDEAAKGIDDYLAIEESRDDRAQTKARDWLRELRIIPAQVDGERAQKRMTTPAEKGMPKKYWSEFDALRQFE